MAPPVGSRPSGDVDAPAVRLRGLSKTFLGRPPVIAVDAVDLDVADGEFFSMLGPSGSGKTTVLRMIAGFEEPTRGTIALAGVDATRRPPHQRAVNTVFQDYALFPHLSVRQNVEYGLRVAKVPRAERRRRVGEALEQVRLPQLADRRPAQLSGGQQQRVALARALVNRPRVLLLDEPLGALDLKLREQMQVELKAIQREVGITFVFVTHDQEEALTLSDRIAVFHAGRVAQVGSARQVYEHPADAFVAGFVGTSNLLHATASRHVLGVEAGAGSFAGVRPERLRVVAHGTDRDGRPGAPGRVRELVYAGPVTRVIVDVGHRAQLIALQQNGTDTWTPQRGDVVDLIWHPDDVIVVPAGPTLPGASPAAPGASPALPGADPAPPETGPAPAGATTATPHTATAVPPHPVDPQGPAR
ncbi:MAG: ABC transporter ATP-binding protein [Angustibacter sp.]